MRVRANFFFRKAWVVVAAALAISACSGGPGQTGSVEILHWWKQGGEADAIGALLGEFKRQYPGVKIVDASVDGSSLARAAIRNRMSMGLPPDTFQANGGWDLMAWVLDNGQSQMRDLESAAQELGAPPLDWIKNVPPQVLDSVSYKGKVYAVPLNIHRVNTFFYNIERFKRFGIDPSTLTSLDAMFAAAETIRQMDSQIVPIALGFRATLGEGATNDNWTLALVFFENLLVARIGGEAYRDLFLNPQPGDAFSPVMSDALADFRRLVSYANVDAPSLTWSQPLDMVLHGEAAMTIMGDWGKGYANAAHFFGDTFGVIPMPGTAGTFVFTTDTFGLPITARPFDDTFNLLQVFGSQKGQDIFNPIKGSISARYDSNIDDAHYDAMAKQTYADFQNATTKVPATSILAPQTYVDAISGALAEFATARDNANPSTVQHALDNYADILQSSCWPSCRPIAP